MNTYDPADLILYIHVASDMSSRSNFLEKASHTCQQLPAGYANRSLRTHLRCNRGTRRMLGDI
jgi:hypothetical protein